VKTGSTPLWRGSCSRTVLREWVHALLVIVGAAAAMPAFAADARIAGIWTPDASRSERFPADPPYTSEGRRIVAEWRASHDPIEDDPGRFCQAPGMPSLALGGADYPLEIIVTPAQVTILMELHQQIRRVFMDLEAHPARLFPQRNGHSIGHWDADTLVVDTAGIRGITYGSVPHSDEVRVVERWRVIDDGASLVNEITISDPIMLREPVVLHQYFERAPAGTRMLEYECAEGMWVEHERAREESADQGRR
jgi:hypothetical protein